MDSNDFDSNALVMHHEEDGTSHQAEGGLGQEEERGSIPTRDDGPDDEDPRERDAYEIEQAVMDFQDEPSVLHDEYPESDSDWDEEVVRERKRNNIRRRRDGTLYYHPTFFNGIAFKDDVLDHALKTGCNIQQYRYDKTKLGYKCVGDGCIWRIYCSVTGKSSKWRVSVFKNVHTCNPNGDCEMVKVPVIARLFLDNMREEPEYFMPMKIEETIKQKWKITIE